MQHLTKKERADRIAILKDRLHDTNLTRSLHWGCDMADVWAAVALAYFERRTTNINEISAATAMDRDKVTRNLKKLHKLRYVTEVKNGNDRLQLIPDHVVFHEDVIRYYQERRISITTAASILTSRIE